MGRVIVGEIAASFIKEKIRKLSRSPVIASQHSLSFQVHSLFQSSANLQLGHQLIYLGGKKKGFVPFGFHFEDEELKPALNLLEIEEAVTVTLDSEEEGTIQIKNKHFYFSLNDCYSGNILKKKQQNTIFFEQWLEVVSRKSFPTGLDFTEELTGSSIYLEALFSAEQEEIEKGLGYYLGRGKGLTPSGDDFLIGIMAVDQLFSAVEPLFYHLLDRRLKEQKWTTDVSTMYLSSGIQKQFSSVVKEVIQPLSWAGERESLDKLDSLIVSGSTSGWDTLAGIYAGILQWKRRSQKNE